MKRLLLGAVVAAVALVPCASASASVIPAGTDVTLSAIVATPGGDAWAAFASRPGVFGFKPGPGSFSDTRTASLPARAVALAVVGTDIWAALSDGSIVSIPTASGAFGYTTIATGLPCAPTALAAGAGKVLAALPSGGTCAGSSIAVLDARNTAQTARLVTGHGRVVRLAVAAGSLWAADAADHALRRLDLDATLTQTGSYAYGGTANDIELGGDGRIWLASADPGAVAALDPRSATPSLDDVTRSIGDPVALTPFDDGVLVADPAEGQLVTVSSAGDVVAEPAHGAPQDVAGVGDGMAVATDANANTLLTFTSRAPKVWANEARGTTAASTVLTGNADAGSEQTDTYFEYGTTTAYGQRTAPMAIAGIYDQGVYGVADGLLPFTTYHYRLVASNFRGVARTGDMTFTTLAATPVLPRMTTTKPVKTVPPVVSPKLPTVAARVSIAADARRAYTRVKQVRVTRLVAGQSVTVVCHGHGCPSMKTRTARKPTLTITGALARAHLRPNARLTVTVSAPKAIARVVTATIRRSKTPKLSAACLPPGATRTKAC